MRNLWPPITVIEREIMYLVAPKAMAGRQPTAVRRGGQIPEGPGVAAGTEDAGSKPVRIPEMPEALRERIAQRVRARSARYSPAPAAGQVLRFDAIGTAPAGDNPEQARPLMALLNAPTAERAIWHGWLVASESDYAGPWDYVLQEDRDGVFDPAVGMVQVWNPVYVRIPERAVVLAELPAERLAAVRALARESAGGAVADEVPVRPGRIWPRRVGGLAVFTGTLLGGRDDPRRRYQELYLRASELLLPGAAVAREPVGGLLDRVVGCIGRWASSAGVSWTPIALVEQPMGAPPDEPVSYQLGDMARLMLLPDPEGRSLHLRILLTRERGFHALLLRGDDPIQKHELTPEAREADFFMGGDERHTLLISDAKRSLEYRIPLS